MTNILDILSNRKISVCQDYVIELTKNELKNIDQETKKFCKILKFSTEWNFDDILLVISKLDPKDYPNAFIIIIDIDSIEDQSSVNFLKRFLINFGENRSLVLQLTWKSENKTKFYYKEEDSNEFQDVEEQQTKNFDDFNSFSSFLWHYLNDKINVEDLTAKKFSNIQNSSQIFKFLRTLELEEKFEDLLVLKCASEGSISDLLAAANGYLDYNKEVCGNDLKYYLCCEFNSTSVLMTAIQHSNQPIIEFLIRNCANLIQQLSFDHQVAISTMTYASNKISILCELLELADFPFPNIANKTSINDERLQKIIDNRAKFHEHIRAENIDEISKFENEQPKLKFAYNLDNKSALAQSLELKSFKAFYYLKSLRFQDQQIENINKDLKTKEKEKASGIALRQRKENIEISSYNKINSVLKLASKSIIYHRNKKNMFEKEQHEKIREWLVDIYKTRYGCKLLDAAAQCEEIKIVFDFECDSTNNADPTGSSQTKGSTYPISKWIFIGAKFVGDKKREEKIKGVIAHEICHYVMRLVYQNDENPYYENDKYAKKKFEEIVVEVKSILADLKLKQNEEESYDGCNGIISTVYDLYNQENWHPELIVRPVQIQVEFYNDIEKFRELEDIYKILFAFFEIFVMSDLKKFNMKQYDDIKKFNNLAVLLNKIRELNIKFSKPKDLRSILENQITVVITNAPKLFLTNIYDCLSENYKEMFDIRNIFIASNILKNSYANESFKNIFKLQNHQLNIIVECSKNFERIIDLVGKNHKFIFLFSDKTQQEKFVKNLKLNPVELTINYKWMDLTIESRKSLLQTKVNFQNNSTFSLFELMQNEANHENQDLYSDEIVDNKLLNLLTQNFGISINQHYEDDSNDKYLRILFQSRDFVEISNKKEQQIIQQEQMLITSKNLKTILIADKAGAGKSWILKTFTKILTEEYPKRWIKYIDLKQFIHKFKVQRTEPEFASFMTKHILKLQSNYESKIFKKLYKNGKISILFDGFDEIAPDCAEFVTKLFQSFQQNGGNQLWIATRDYFEVDLKEKLKVDAVYKIHKFTEENGIKLIASSWLFDELQKKGENYNEIFHPKYLEKLKKYKIIAQKLNQKIPKSKNDSIGLPHFFKMIADISSENKEVAENFTTLNIFDKCVDVKYKVWANEKGELRTKANVKSQHLELNYHKLHQLVAMESLFPKDSEFGDLCREELKEWSKEEIIACGVLCEKFGKFLFTHETYREYYAAKFVLNMLTKWQHHENACKYLLQFLTIKKFEIIRIFLNDALGDKKVLTKIMSNIPRIAKFVDCNIQDFENSSEIFEEKFQNLVEFVIKIFTYSRKEKMKNILLKNKKITLFAAKTPTLFIQIQYMILDYFDKTELNNFLAKDATLFEILYVIPDPENAAEFLNSLKCKTCPQFINQANKMKNDKGENIFMYLLKSSNLNMERLKKGFEIFKQHLTADEIIHLFGQVEKNYKENFLHIAAKSTKIEFHEAFWELLLSIFKNREELKDLILKENKYGDNFVHYLVIVNKPEIIEFTITKIKENLSSDQYKEILKSKGLVGRNLLQQAACSSKDIRTHEILWKIFREFCNSDEEFLEFLIKDDNQKNNVFHIAAAFTSKEIFEFLIDELEKLMKEEKIKNIFGTLGMENKNLLQSAARLNKSVEFHEYLWTIMKNYFNPQEILNMIKHVNEFGYNLIHSVVARNSEEIVNLTWNEIKKFIKSKKDQIKYLKKTSYLHQNLLQKAIFNVDHGAEVQLWVRNLAIEYNIIYY